MDTHDRTHTAAAPKAAQEPIATLDDITRPLDTFGKIVFLVIVVEIIVMFGLNLYENSRFTTLSNQLAASKNELNSTANTTLNTQVESVLAGSDKLKSALAGKMNWGTFYTNLDNVTPKDVRLTSISVSGNGSFKADGEAASLTSLAKAMVAWKSGAAGHDTPFSSVTLNNNGYSADAGNRRVTFSISGQVNIGKLQ